MKTRDAGGQIYRGIKIKGSNSQSLPHKRSLPEQNDIVMQLQGMVAALQITNQKLVEENTRLYEQLQREREEDKTVENLEREKNNLVAQNQKLSENCLNMTKQVKTIKQKCEIMRREKALLEAKVRSKAKGEQNCQKKRERQECSKLPYYKYEKLSVANFIDPSELLENKKDGHDINIGEGTFGRCKLKTFLRTGTLVVCKELKPVLSDKVAAVNEARFLQGLTHRAFPFLFGVQVQERPYSLVLEFLPTQDGGRESPTLADVLDNKSSLAQNVRQNMTRTDWKLFSEDLAEGLCHLHSKLFLHNDLN